MVFYFLIIIVIGETGSTNSPFTLSGLFPPTSVCSLLPASLSATILLLFVIYIFYSHYLCLSLSFLFLCHFLSASSCHYSAHMSRLKRQPLLPACVICFCGGCHFDTNFVSAHVRICTCLYVCISDLSISTISQSLLLLSVGGGGGSSKNFLTRFYHLANFEPDLLDKCGGDPLQECSGITVWLRDRRSLFLLKADLRPIFNFRMTKTESRLLPYFFHHSKSTNLHTKIAVLPKKKCDFAHVLPAAKAKTNLKILKVSDPSN